VFNGKEYICITSHFAHKGWEPEKRMDLWLRNVIHVSGKATAWEKGIKWNTGDLAEYNGKIYVCCSAHVSQNGWTPENMTNLWKKK